MSTTPAVRADDIPRLSHAEWVELAATQSNRFIGLLRSLSDAEWDGPSGCEGWAVRDVAAHVLGWAEALTSPPAYLRQILGGRKVRARDGSSPLDAQNAYQVESRRDMSRAEIMMALDRQLHRFLALRKWSAVPLGVVPFKEAFTGKWVTLRYVMDTIFTRDHFMHRLDISGALDRPVFVDDAERMLVSDAVREWAERSKADVRLELQGDAAGSFVCGSGVAGTVTIDALDFTRLAAARLADPRIEGDEGSIRGWLEVLCTF